MSENEVCICRRCEVAAQINLVDGQISRVACPTCGVVLEGDAARKMYIEQAKYLSRKKLLDLSRRSARKNRSNSVRIRHVLNKANDPGWPFLIGKPES